MCQQHWLCRTGKHGWCYFAVGELGSGPGASDIEDVLWNELDGLHARLRAHPTARDIASELGAKLHFALRSAASLNRTLGERRQRELEARYADEPTEHNTPRPFRVTIRGDQDATSAAAEIRKLGEVFAKAIADELHKAIGIVLDDAGGTYHRPT